MKKYLKRSFPNRNEQKRARCLKKLEAKTILSKKYCSKIAQKPNFSRFRRIVSINRTRHLEFMHLFSTTTKSFMGFFHRCWDSSFRLLFKWTIKHFLGTTLLDDFNSFKSLKIWNFERQAFLKGIIPTITSRELQNQILPEFHFI